MQLCGTPCIFCEGCEHLSRVTGCLSDHSSVICSLCLCCCACAHRYQEATGGQPERMASGSDDFTMFLWSPSTSKQHVARLTGHVQTVNQVRAEDRLRFRLAARKQQKPCTKSIA